MKKKLSVLIVFSFSFLTGCDSDYPWSKGIIGTAKGCSGIATDTRLKPSDEGYEIPNADMYGWTCLHPDYVEDLLKDKEDIEARLKKCELQFSDK